MTEGPDDEERTSEGEVPAPRPTRRQRFKRAWRHVMGEPAAMDFFGPATLGPGRNATQEEWARFRREMRAPRPKGPSTPPPGYKFVWYTDGMGMRHRAAVRDTAPTQDGEPDPRP